MDEATVKAICQAIHDESPAATGKMKMPSPGALIDTALAGLKEIDAVYLPALIQVLETLKTFTPV